MANRLLVSSVLLFSSLRAANETDGTEHTAIDISDTQNYGTLEQSPAHDTGGSIFHEMAADLPWDRILSNATEQDRDLIAQRCRKLSCYDCTWDGSPTTISALFPAHAIRRTRGFKILRGFDTTAKKLYFCVPLMFSRRNPEPHFLLFIINQTDAESMLCAMSANHTLKPFPKQLKADDILRVLNDFILVRGGPMFEHMSARNESIVIHDVEMVVQFGDQERLPGPTGPVWETLIFLFLPCFFANSLQTMGMSDHALLNLMGVIRVFCVISMLWYYYAANMRRVSVLFAVFVGTFWYFIVACIALLFN